MYPLWTHVKTRGNKCSVDIFNSLSLFLYYHFYRGVTPLYFDFYWRLHLPKPQYSEAEHEAILNDTNPITRIWNARQINQTISITQSCCVPYSWLGNWLFQFSVTSTRSVFYLILQNPVYRWFQCCVVITGPLDRTRQMFPTIFNYIKSNIAYVQ